MRQGPHIRAFWGFAGTKVSERLPRILHPSSDPIDGRLDEG